MAEFNVWLLILGVALGAAFTWLIIGTVARSDDDVAAAERPGEARWITRTIEEHGGRAPTDLVEQILLLNRRYLQGRAGSALSEEELETEVEEGEVEEGELEGAEPEAPEQAPLPEPAQPSAIEEPPDPTR